LDNEDASMSYVEKTEENIEFSLGGDDYLTTKQWVSEIARSVFINQLETGMYDQSG